MDKELVLVLDFGGQYNQLIARRVRELSVYSEMVPFDIPFEEVVSKKPGGIILTGGPESVHAENSPACDPRIFTMGVPVLGICYGCSSWHTFRRQRYRRQGEGVWPQPAKDH
jgi:GMP synthase (glutamine-hydrolysing)